MEHNSILKNIKSYEIFQVRLHFVSQQLMKSFKADTEFTCFCSLGFYYSIDGKDTL